MRTEDMAQVTIASQLMRCVSGLIECVSTVLNQHKANPILRRLRDAII